MSIQYSGGPIVYASFMGTSRLMLVNNIQAQLVNAGWTLIRNNSANDYVLESATTPQGLKIRVRIYDPGTGNSARIKMMNSSETISQTGDCFLRPRTDFEFFIIANKYQFFISNGSATRFAGDSLCGGVPYIPPFLNGVITEAAWIVCNTNSDTDATARIHFRDSLFCGATTTAGNQFCLCNGSRMERNNATSGAGVLRVLAKVAGLKRQNTLYSWSSGTDVIYEPLIAWGLNGHTDESKIRGQIWDSCIVMNPNPYTLQKEMDGCVFIPYTINNIYGSNNVQGSIYLAIS